MDFGAKRPLCVRAGYPQGKRNEVFCGVVSRHKSLHKWKNSRPKKEQNQALFCSLNGSYF
jgi:hypothetical protein